MYTIQSKDSITDYPGIGSKGMQNNKSFINNLYFVESPDLFIRLFI